MTKKANKYYNLDNILKVNADYNVIIGERSNGKTFAVLEYAIKQYICKKTQTAYIRRWQEDLKGKRAQTLFAGHSDKISDLTNGKYNATIYSVGKWFLYDTNSDLKDDTPFCFAFTLSESEHDKSTSYPNITTIIFDEFITRRYYLPDEFIIYMNTLSTIIRQRDSVKIFMLGNTVNKYCPYFVEMGLKNIVQQAQGTIDIYKFGKDKNALKVAVEYTKSTENSKESNKYFAFDNENLQMITAGKWELSIYPHLQKKYLPKDVKFVFYIIFNDTILQGNIIITPYDNYIFLHPKTTPIKNIKNALIYTLEDATNNNYKRKLISNQTELDAKITKYFATNKVFYANNDVGEVVRNYIKVAHTDNLIK